MMCNGELLPPRCQLDVIMRVEEDENEHYTTDEVRAARGAAANYAIDAWIENAYDTPEDEHWNQKEMAAHYEAMRPTTIRKAALLADL